MQIGNKPKYVSSQPSNFMKAIEEEIAEKKAKDARDAKERSMIEEDDSESNQESKDKVKDT